MADTTEVLKDAEKQEDRKHCRFEVVDGKIIAHFNAEPNGNFDDWVSIDKVFDTFDAFADYAKTFFDTEF